MTRARRILAEIEQTPLRDVADQLSSCIVTLERLADDDFYEVNTVLWADPGAMRRVVQAVARAALAGVPAQRVP